VRFLVVEDEKSHPLSLVTIGADGSVDTTALTAGLFQMFSEFWKLDDLEGLTLDRAGFVYGITSHSRDDDGDAKKSREKLVRFRVEGKRVVDPKVVVGLKQALTMRHAVLAAAAQVRDVKTSGGLNIEALEISPDQKRLLIGFRSPLRDGRALIAIVENPLASSNRMRRPESRLCSSNWILAATASAACHTFQPWAHIWSSVARRHASPPTLTSGAGVASQGRRHAVSRYLACAALRRPKGCALP
jgi:hypothetical protein